MLTPWEKRYDKLRQHIKKQRHYFSNKVSYSQSYGFIHTVVMYGCESWTINWAPKNWCFWTIVLKNTLESPLDCKEIHLVHPKGISPEYSLEGLMLKLKLQYSGHLMRRIVSLAKTLMLGKIEDGKRRGWQRMRWLDGITDTMNMSFT